MSLRGIQRGIEHFYDVRTGLDVEDFLVDEDSVPTDDGRLRGETLLLEAQDDGSAYVGLWVDPASLARLDRTPVGHWVEGDALPDFCKALEGVSHFVYLAFRAASDRPVSLFEMELQAEVDKFVAASLLAREGGAGPDAIAALRVRLFDDADFLDDEGTDDGVRYRRANRLAGRLALELTESLGRPSGRGAAVALLRKFYRLGGEEKVRLMG